MINGVTFYQIGLGVVSTQGILNPSSSWQMGSQGQLVWGKSCPKSSWKIQMCEQLPACSTCRENLGGRIELFFPMLFSGKAVVSAHYQFLHSVQMCYFPQALAGSPFPHTGWFSQGLCRECGGWSTPQLLGGAGNFLTCIRPTALSRRGAICLQVRGQYSYIQSRW